MTKKLEKWYRITKKLEIEEYDKPDISNAKTTKYWLKRNFNGRTHTTSAGNEYELYDYIIYNEYVEETVISEMNLTCYDIHDSYDSMVNGTYMEFEMKDSYKSNKKITMGGNYSRSEIIIDAIKFMKEFGTFRAWEAIELYQENTELKKKITELENTIKLSEKKKN